MNGFQASANGGHGVAPEELVAVRPTYLAFGTKPGAQAAIGVLEASAGCRRHSSVGHLTLDLPGNLLVTVRPGVTTLGLSMLSVVAFNHRSTPLWWSRFSAGTPDEVLTAFTTALVNSPGQRGDLSATTPPPAEPVFGILRQVGWATYMESSTPGEEAQGMVSADGMADAARLIRHIPSPLGVLAEPDYWRLTAGQHPSIWSASFSSRAPTHLVESVTAAMASPARVLRQRSQLRPELLAYMDLPHESAPHDSPRRAAALRRSGTAARAIPPSVAAIVSAPAAALSRPPTPPPRR